MQLNKLKVSVVPVSPISINGALADRIEIDLATMTLSAFSQGTLLANVPVKQGANTVEYAIII